MAKRKWDVKGRCGDLKGWIVANHERVEVLGRIRLEQVASRQPGVNVSDSVFGLQSIMFAAKAIVGLMDGDDAAIEFLYQAAFSARYKLSLQAANYYLHPAGGRSVCLPNDAALDLALSFVLGCVEEANEIAGLMIRGFTDGLFYQPAASRVVPYILGLNAQWNKLPIPEYRCRITVDQAYIRLLSSWTDQDLGELTGTLGRACDLHMARSRYDTDTAEYEFSRTSYAILPVEILMVLRMRELRGLVVPEIDHPVMNTRVARLFPIRHVEPDSLLSTAFSVMLERIETLRAEWR